LGIHINDKSGVFNHLHLSEIPALNKTQPSPGLAKFFSTVYSGLSKFALQGEEKFVKDAPTSNSTKSGFKMNSKFIGTTTSRSLNEYFSIGNSQVQPNMEEINRLETDVLNISLLVPNTNAANKIIGSINPGLGAPNASDQYIRGSESIYRSRSRANSRIGSIVSFSELPKEGLPLSQNISLNLEASESATISKFKDSLINEQTTRKINGRNAPKTNIYSRNAVNEKIINFKNLPSDRNLSSARSSSNRTFVGSAGIRSMSSFDSRPSSSKTPGLIGNLPRC
jgi:hypothetical protein